MCNTCQIFVDIQNWFSYEVQFVSELYQLNIQMLSWRVWQCVSTYCHAVSLEHVGMDIILMGWFLRQQDHLTALGTLYLTWTSSRGQLLVTVLSFSDLAFNQYFTNAAFPGTLSVRPTRCSEAKFFNKIACRHFYYVLNYNGKGSRQLFIKISDIYHSCQQGWSGLGLQGPLPRSLINWPGPLALMILVGCSNQWST